MAQRSMAALLLAAAFTSGCMTGPNYLTNSVNDVQNQQYGESPVFTGLMTDILPVYPIIKFFAWIPDVLILNPVQFWGVDIWRGEGSAFRHKNPSSTKDPWFK